MPPYRVPRPLDPVEIRVLGCLVEKELSNPDVYPLSLKALTAAANQKSNRDPVLDLDDGAVEEALERLLPEVLVWRVRTSRVLRWQHNLDSKWELAPGEKAMLAELLLRGEQTPGELRSRSSRMHEIEDLSTVHRHLERLAGTDLSLVEELPRQPGQKETRWRHRLGESATAEAGRRVEADSPPGSLPYPSPGGLEARITSLEDRVERLSLELARLRAEVGAETKA